MCKEGDSNKIKKESHTDMDLILEHRFYENRPLACLLTIVSLLRAQNGAYGRYSGNICRVDEREK